MSNSQNIKLTVTATNWRPLLKNTLRGFVTAHVAELRMSFLDIAIHEKNGKAWAAVPSRPWIKDGVVLRDENEKPSYSPIVEFDSPEVRSAFSDAVVRAVEAKFPGALALEGAL
jgi:hypothetical protein